MAETTRRNFLKNTAKAAVVAGAGLTLEEILGGCATISFKETAPVIYPPLKGHKVQPPNDGCLIGFFRPSASFGQPVPYGCEDYYQDKLGQKPAILVALMQYLPYFFPGQVSEKWAKKGITPIVYAGVDRPQFKSIPTGKYDDDLKQAAEGAVQYGQKHGGFFLNPMWEMNITSQHSPYPYGDQAGQFKKVWKHIWQIFEEKGANKYATWVIEYHTDFSLQGYFPGEQQVDWIGLSAYNRTIHQRHYGYRSLEDLISQPYHYFRTNYPNKPVMLAEFATTVEQKQAEWVQKAYQSIKSKPGIKAAIYWDNKNWQLGDDHSLTTDSLETVKEILRDPYFIMAK